jgi:Ca2+-binding EF-hand superfamily protein
LQETAAEKAIMSFKLLDVNGDGELNEDEFVEGCMRDNTLAELLNAGM